MLLNSCTTEPQTGSLAGTVNLEGESDHTGITLGIYELVTLDTTITRINNQYPHIGIKISQHTEFDHRFGTLLKTGETDASGHLEIQDIPTGIYNVVAIKDGFGFRYIYNVQINSGDNTLPATKAILTLYSETLINSDISSPTTWQTGHHYIIEQDIIVYDVLTIEPGAVIRLNQGKDITSYGTFNAVGEYENFIWLTKNDGFSENLNTVEPDSNYNWDKVTLEPYSQAQIQYCKFDCANIGLLNHINGFEISDCIFRNSNCGFKAENADSAFCSNLLCEYISDENEAGIYYWLVTDGLIEKNIVYDCEKGVTIKDESNPIIRNNLLNSCYISIYNSWFSLPEIINNEIYTSFYGIVGTFSIVKRNILYARVCISTPRWTTISENNIKGSQYSIRKGFYQNTNHVYDTDATNNYFFSIDENEINNLIYDKNDVEEFEQIHIGEVFYIPFLTQEYPYAGIQVE